MVGGKRGAGFYESRITYRRDGGCCHAECVRTSSIRFVGGVAMWSRADQRSATEPESSSDEKRTCMPDRNAPACTYITDRIPPGLPHFFPRRLLTTTNAAPKRKVVSGGPLSLRLHSSFRSGHFPLFSLFYSFLFISLQWSTRTFTQRSGQPSSASSLLHCMSQITPLPLVVGPGSKLTDRVLYCSIFGILSMQCYTYYHRYPLDRPFYKILVR